jgi:ethanolamine utilization protein EutQ (cupin superfamily)
MNPPYGNHAATWLERLAKHGDGIALVFARTETRMFFDWVWPYASAMLFIEGRLHFHRPDGTRAKANSGAPSVLIAYGHEAAQRLITSDIPGARVEIGPVKSRAA